MPIPISMDRDRLAERRQRGEKVSPMRKSKSALCFFYKTINSSPLFLLDFQWCCKVYYTMSVHFAYLSIQVIYNLISRQPCSLTLSNAQKCQEATLFIACRTTITSASNRKLASLVKVDNYKTIEASVI